MEQFRLIAAIVLSALVFILWNFLFPSPKPPEQETSVIIAAPEQPVTESSSPKASPELAPGDSDKPAEIPKTTAVPSAPPVSSRIYTIETPLYTVNISELGAAFKSISLKKYRETGAQDSPQKELLPKGLGGSLLVSTETKSIADLETAIFTGPAQENLEIRDTEQSLVFTFTSPAGFVVERIYTFKPDSYLITSQVRIRNTGITAISDRLGFSMVSHIPKEAQIGFEGPCFLMDGSLEQATVKSIKKKDRFDGKVRWLALQDRYFATAMIPEKEDIAQVRISLVGGEEGYKATYFTEPFTLNPGSAITKDLFFYAGPKSVSILKESGFGLTAMVDFGWFEVLARPFLWLLNLLFGIIPNYGVAIILLTIIIKILLWPLGSKSYRAMNEMKKIQPLMAEIRAKYPNDKQKMNEEVMNLYRTYKINPLSGCLPLLAQLPIFIALYRMLYGAIELRHAPFVGWIQDLAAPDRLFDFAISIPLMQPPYGIPVLTLVMGATMFIQQKMSPPAGDPMQAKIMMFMPLLFTVIFINFPAGLVLYWLVNNVLSIAQQYYIMKTAR